MPAHTPYSKPRQEFNSYVYTYSTCIISLLNQVLGTELSSSSCVYTYIPTYTSNIHIHTFIHTYTYIIYTYIPQVELKLTKIASEVWPSLDYTGGPRVRATAPKPGNLTAPQPYPLMYVCMYVDTI